MYFGFEENTLKFCFTTRIAHLNVSSFFFLESKPLVYLLSVLLSVKPTSLCIILRSLVVCRTIAALLVHNYYACFIYKLQITVRPTANVNIRNYCLYIRITFMEMHVTAYNLLLNPIRIFFFLQRKMATDNFQSLITIAIISCLPNRRAVIYETMRLEFKSRWCARITSVIHIFLVSFRIIFSSSFVCCPLYVR